MHPIPKLTHHHHHDDDGDGWERVNCWEDKIVREELDDLSLLGEERNSVRITEREKAKSEGGNKFSSQNAVMHHHLFNLSFSCFISFILIFWTGDFLVLL